MIVGKRKIKSGTRFNYLFPRASGRDIQVKKNAKLSDTIQQIKKVVRENSWQVKKLAQFLKAESITKTCRNIWEFAYNHFQYQIDKMGVEQIRTPARSWRDRKSGIDCDCFSTLIGATLYRLKIPFIFRITRYSSDQFEHIYPIALIGNKQIILDAVIDEFNREVPFTEKKDIIMELHTLNGITARSILDEIDDEKSFSNPDLSIDALDLFSDDIEELSGLEGKREREARRAKRKEKRQQNKKEGSLKERVKEKIAKGKKFLTKVNPAIALLRAGILASMKLNVFKVASKLRFAYWTTEEARRNNMDLNKFNQLQRIREKMEGIFLKAGGKPTKLKKAILTGKGNRNRMVQLSGLGMVIEMPSDEDDLRTILGDLYSEDFDNETLNGLGAVAATGAVITAASGVMATISRIIKKLGGLFKQGSKEAQQEQIQDNTDNQEDKHRKFSVRNIFSKLKEKAQQRKLRKQQQAQNGEEIPEDPTTEFLPDNIDNVSIEQAEMEQTQPQESQQSEQTETMQNNDDQEESNSKGSNSFWKWIVPVGSAIVIGGVATGIYISKKKRAKAAAEAAKTKGVNGIGELGAVKKSSSKTKKKAMAKTPKAATTKKKNSSKTRKPKPQKKAVELIP